MTLLTCGSTSTK
jgi:hypothetical protein